ncbi:MAG: hypothetical protein JNK02_04935 [Planctomycetes bacterium]|nr:hypothetical protein [Planctomycetota bacterium]
MSASRAASELLALERRAGRVHAVVRALECVAVGLASGALVLAAGLASGAELARDLILASAFVALLAVLLSWRERSPRTADVVQRADRAARLDGALAAALDAARRPRAPAAELAALLVERVRAAVRAPDLVRAALPRTPLFLVAPLAGAALVLFALERRPGEAGPVRAGVGALRAAAALGRDLGDPEAVAVLEAALARLEAAPPGHQAEARAVAEASRALERLGRERGPSDPLRAELEAARAALETGAAPGGAPAGSARPEGTGLANRGADGRMFGPPAGGEPAPGAGGPVIGTPVAGGTGRGARSARWWPSRYDAVVEGYLAP